MTFPLFDWDGGNLSHIARHSVAADEAEAAILDPRQRSTGIRIEDGEQRFGVIGATAAGRILFVSCTLRAGLIRVVTAYPANPRQRHRYRER